MEEHLGFVEEQERRQPIVGGLTLQSLPRLRLQPLGLGQGGLRPGRLPEFVLRHGQHGSCRQRMDRAVRMICGFPQPFGRGIESALAVFGHAFRQFKQVPGFVLRAGR